MPEMKTCTTCGNAYEATADNFYRCKKVKKDGLMSTCKNCKREYDKQYQLQNKEKQNNWNKAYRERNPEKTKAYRNKYRQEHRVEVLEYTREYYKKNSKRIQENNARTRKPETPEQRRARYDTYKENSRIRVHKYLAKKKSLEATLNKNEWNDCVKFFEHKCAYCGAEAKLVREHFVPVFSGGGFTKENIVPACQKCNNSKRAKDFFEWYPDQLFYSKEREQRILNYLNSEKTAEI